MKTEFSDNEYDAIVIGSGACGATIAKELSAEKKKVLLLEKGAYAPLRDSIKGIASIADEVTVGDKMKAMRAIATGGSTGLYFAVADPPPLDAFRAVGIDLSAAYEKVRMQVPLDYLPDALLGEQVLRVRQSALDLGYHWNKNRMLIDQSKCNSNYSHEAKWKARSFVEDAVRDGATLINHATVRKIITEKSSAVGVEYRRKKGLKGFKVCRAYGTKIVLAAGSLASPEILRKSGIDDIADKGFFCDPAFALFGTVPEMKGKDNFIGSMSTDYEDDISLGDGNMTKSLYKLFVFSNFKLRRLFSFSRTIGVGVKLKDAMGGRLLKDHRYNKQLSNAEYMKLKKGEDAAAKILKSAGARIIFRGKLVAGNPGGMVRIQEHLDGNLETKYRNLHVCDASVLSEDMRVTPTLTLLCLGNYLAGRLLLSL